jgi:hypothetical protein
VDDPIADPTVVMLGRSACDWLTAQDVLPCDHAQQWLWVRALTPKPSKAVHTLFHRMDHVLNLANTDTVPLII